jgi:hypothetical protein
VEHVVTGSNGKGKLINGTRPFLYFADSDGNNTLFGIKLNQGATNATIINTFVNGNGGAGLQLQGASGAHITGVDANSNGRYGIWLNGAPGNLVASFSAQNNAIAGVYLGCSSTGPTGVPCPAGVTPSSGNQVSGIAVVSASLLGTDERSVSSNATSQHFGIAIDTGNIGNLVSLVTSQGNLSEDMIDKNTNCASNSWQLNTFITSSPPLGTTRFCIN